jgi:hypothetical protein
MNASKGTYKSSSTNTGGSKSPMKKPINNQGGLQIKPNVMDGGKLTLNFFTFYSKWKKSTNGR